MHHRPIDAAKKRKNQNQDSVRQLIFPTRRTCGVRKALEQWGVILACKTCSLKTECFYHLTSDTFSLPSSRQFPKSGRDGVHMLPRIWARPLPHDRCQDSFSFLKFVDTADRHNAIEAIGIIQWNVLSCNNLDSFLRGHSPHDTSNRMYFGIGIACQFMSHFLFLVHC
jgi:hypothetical protein